MSRGAKTQRYIMGLKAGVSSDSDAIVVETLDSNNAMMTPDGSATRPRLGMDIAARYLPEPTSPVGRIALMIESNPVDSNIGNQFMRIHTGRNNQILSSLIVRDRTELEGQSFDSLVFWGIDLMFFPTLEDEVGLYRTFNVSRSGDLSYEDTVHVKTVNGTATAGVDFEAFDGTVTIAAGQRDSEDFRISSLIVPPYPGDWYFYLDIVSARGQVYTPSRARIEYEEH